MARTGTHTSGCYFCHALKRPYEPVERATAIEANVDWHRHVLADHADLAWTQDNEARVREFIEANQPKDSVQGDAKLLQNAGVADADQDHTNWSEA